jgi:molecular chaperone DnaK (HSP70)
MSYSGGHFRWGLQASKLPDELIRGVKLLLDENQSHKYSPSLRTKKLLGVIRKSAVEVSATYLENLICHVHRSLERQFGSAVKEMNTSFILTVSAVWSDKAKDATLKVAVKAGIPQNQLCLLSEPEAAAIYTLKTIQPNPIKVFACGYVYDVIEY